MADSSFNHQNSRVSDEPVVHIITAPNEPVARMWADILKQNGIHSLIKIEDLRAAMYVFYYSPFCRIYVLASQRDRATRILTPLSRAIKLSYPKGTYPPIRMSPIFLCIYIFTCILWLGGGGYRPWMSSLLSLFSWNC